MNLDSGKASLLFIPIAAAITAVCSAVLASPFLLAAWWKEGHFSVNAFLFPFGIWSIFGALASTNFLIEQAIEEPESWLGKLASGLFGLSMFISMLAVLVFIGLGLHILFRSDLTIGLVVSFAIAYVICYGLHSQLKKKAVKHGD